MTELFPWLANEFVAPACVLALLFIPLERAFRLHRQPILRQDWRTDGAYMVGQYLLWTTPVVAALVALHRWVLALPLEPIQAGLASLPLPLQAIIAVLVSDLCVYWGHRLSHTVPFLWRFHKVHHTSETLDWLAAHREHPLDNLYTRTIENAPVFLLGFSLESVAGFVAFRALWGMVIHSNTHLPLGPLRFLVGAPRLHHWHHSRDRPGYNYANLMPLMDCLFGTFYDPGHPPQAYGIVERVPRDYCAQLWRPLTPSGLTGQEQRSGDRGDEGYAMPDIAR